MIDYQLASELKKAGFPQDDAYYGYVKYDDEGIFLRYLDDEPRAPLAVAPNLSELIEKCGDRFKILAHELDTKSLNSWYASDGTKLWKDDECWGMTPEEAVARLWLELNKK